MPPKKRNQTQKAIGRLSRDLVPRPHSFTPPRDPPTIVSNPVRKVVIDLFLSLVNTTIFNVTVATLRTQLEGQLGLPVSKQYFIIKSMAAWVSTGSAVGPTSQSISLKMLEPTFGIESRDDPSPMENARVGICYPKTVQPLIPPTLPGTNVALSLYSSSGQPTGVTLRVSVDLWGSSI